MPTLSINVQNPINDVNEFTAQSFMPYKYEIDTMITGLYENPFYFGSEEEDSTVVLLYLNGFTEPNVSYSYLINIYKNDTSIFESYVEGDIFTDSYTELDNDRALFLSYSEGFVEGDTLSIEIYSITEPFYNFLDALKQISVPADPFGFSGTMADAVGNINEGNQLGFFFTASISRATAIVKKDAFEKKNSLLEVIPKVQ